jgi:hypothetical protein
MGSTDGSRDCTKATVEENVGNRKVEVVSLAFNCSMVCNVAAAMMTSWSIWLFVGETKI